MKLFGSSGKQTFTKNAYVVHHHHSWERQGFAGSGKDDIVEIFECAKDNCDAWTAVDKPQDTRQQFRLGTVVNREAETDADDTSKVVE